MLLASKDVARPVTDEPSSLQTPLKRLSRTSVMLSNTDSLILVGACVPAARHRIIAHYNCLGQWEGGGAGCSAEPELRVQ